MSSASRLAPSSPEDESFESGQLNFDKLHYVYWEAAPTFLRQAFRDFWDSLTGSPWEDKKSYAHQLLKTSLGHEILRLCRQLQTELVQSGNSRLWNLPLLLEIFCVIVDEAPSHLSSPGMTSENFMKLRIARKSLENDRQTSVDDETFNSLWNMTAKTLTSMGMSCDLLKKPGTPLETLITVTMGEIKAETFRLAGNESYKEGKFAQAAVEYSKGIDLEDVSPETLGVLFSNRSAAYFKENDLEKATEDATTSITLRPSWFRGYARLGTALAKLKHFDQAVLNLSIAIRQGDKSTGTLDLLNKCKLTIEKGDVRIYSDAGPPDNSHKEKKKRDDAFKNMNDVIKEIGPSFEGSPMNLSITGERYLLGIGGLPVDLKKAVLYFSKAAEQGESLGLFHLALMMKTGKGLPKDLKKSHAFLLKAASNKPLREFVKGFKLRDFGVPQAYCALAYAYQHGEGVDVDLVKAVEWYYKALEFGGDMRAGKAAAYSLGLIFNDYANRRAKIKVDMAKAREYWKLSAHLGFVTAMESTAIYFQEERKDSLAQKWFHFAVHKESVYFQTRRALFMKDPLLERNFDPKKFAVELEEHVRLSPTVGPWLYKIEEFLRNSNLDESTGRFQGVEIAEMKGRAEAIVKHRELMKGKVEKGKGKREVTFANVNLVGLKEIFFAELEGQKESRLFKGRVLRVSVIEDVICGSPALQVLVEDANGDVGRVFVRNFPQEEKESAQLAYGSRLFILHPDFRKMDDGLYGIHVDNPKVTLKITSVNPNRCRYCGKAAGNKVPCQICRRVTYCSKSCIDKDAEELQHSLLCLNVLD